MPRLKDHTDAMRRVLNAYELNIGCRLGSVLGVAPATALRRIENPEDLTVRELRLLASRGHVPIDELRAALAREQQLIDETRHL